MGNIVPQNPATESQRQRLFQQLASLPPDVRAFIGQQYGESQISVLPLPYWSAMRFQAAVAGAGPFTYTIDTTTRIAFAYARGQSPAIAGFPAAYGNATEAETNLLKANETRDNSDVWIWGVAAHLSPDSEPALARRVWRDTDVQISLNGTQSIPLGRLEMFPGAGGLYGSGPTFLRAPDGITAGPGVDGGVGAQMGFVGNGYPAAGNFFRLPQPFKWAAVGSAGADSSLNISCTPRRTIVESAIARAAIPVTANITSVGTEAFTPPVANAMGTYVDVIWHLICVAVSKRSVNV